jgi:hypothetical protein
MADDLAEFFDRVGSEHTRVWRCRRNECPALVTNNPELKRNVCRSCNIMRVQCKCGAMGFCEPRYEGCAYTEELNANG